MRVRRAGTPCRRRTRRQAAGEAKLGAFAAEEFVRDLDEDARAVAGFRIAAAGAAMREVDEDLNALGDDFVRRLAIDIDDETDTAGIALIMRDCTALVRQEDRCLSRPDSSRPSGSSRKVCAGFSAGWLARPENTTGCKCCKHRVRPKTRPGWACLGLPDRVSIALVSVLRQSTIQNQVN